MGPGGAGVGPGGAGLGLERVWGGSRRVWGGSRRVLGGSRSRKDHGGSRRKWVVRWIRQCKVLSTPNLCPHPPRWELSLTRLTPGHASPSRLLSQVCPV